MNLKVLPPSGLKLVVPDVSTTSDLSPLLQAMAIPVLWRGFSSFGHRPGIWPSFANHSCIGPYLGIVLTKAGVLWNVKHRDWVRGSLFSGVPKSYSGTLEPSAALLLPHSPPPPQPPSMWLLQVASASQERVRPMHGKRTRTETADQLVESLKSTPTRDVQVTQPNTCFC